MNRIFVLDMDGCISDDRARRHLIDDHAATPEEKYDAYHRASMDDPPIQGNIRLAKELSKTAMPVVITSRSEVAREETEKWLVNHAPFRVDHVLMRPLGNHDPSIILKPALLQDWVAGLGHTSVDITLCLDDREDVLAAWRDLGLRAIRVGLDRDEPLSEVRCGPAAILRNMAATCEDRQGMYGEVWRIVPQLVGLLFPDGVPPWLLTDPRWHLFELALVKLARFAHSDLKHRDSIHDMGVFCALVENVIAEEENKSD